MIDIILYFILIIIAIIAIPIIIFIYFTIIDYKNGKKEKFYILLIHVVLLILFILYLYNVDDKSNIKKPTETEFNKDEIYKIQFGNLPDTTIVKVLEADYWESSHWTYEYKTFLKLEYKEEWFNKFNNLEKVVLKEQLEINNSPKWFSPSKKSIVYKSQTVDIHNFVIYQDTITKIIFYYDSQL